MSGRLEEGNTLEGKYRIIRRLGEGGMGVVYEAEHTDLHLRVAIKVLHASESFDPNMIARFKTEARSAASIRHNNVVEVTDFGLTDDQRPFFVMEYLAGESLADRLDRRHTLTERETVEITDQILSGLESAHKKGVVHRDLKPENVLIAKRDDGREVVKLLDFGIAKIVGGTTSHHAVYDESRPKTQRGVVLGTPGYMAPETVTGRAAADQRSDLFSVGVICYEMLVGQRPFTGATPHEIMMATATKPVPRPGAIKSGISEAMERMVLTALAKDPVDRYQNTEEFVRHLTAAAVGRIPSDARHCKTRVGMPSVIPPRRSVDRNIATEVVPARSEIGAVSFPKPRRSSTDVLSRSGPYKGPARTRRVVIPFSPWIILFLLIVAGGVYYFFFYGDPLRVIEHDEVRKIHEVADPGTSIPDDVAGEAVEEPLSNRAEGEARVTIWLDIRPNSAAVTLDGKAVSFRPILVPRSEDNVELGFDAPGYEPKTIRIVPDEEKTIRVRLKKLGKKR